MTKYWRGYVVADEQENVIVEALRRNLISEDEAKSRLSALDAATVSESPVLATPSAETQEVRDLRRAEQQSQEFEERPIAAAVGGGFGGRVAQAAFEPLTEPATEFTAIRERLVRPEISPTLSAINDVILQGGEKSVDLLRSLETLITAPFRAGVQVSGELSGDDQKEIERSQKDLQEFINVGLLPLGAKPSSFKTTRGQVTPDAAARKRISEERSLQEPVPLTRGDITQDFPQQAFEEAAATGTKGPQAQAIIAGRRGEQAEALKANVEATQRQLSGRERPLVQAERGRGAAQATGELRDIAKADRKAISDAYDVAKESGATVEPKLINDFSDDMRNILDADFDLELMTDVTKNLDDLKKFAAIEGDLTANTLNRVQALRKRISNTQQKFKLSDGPQSEAARRLKGSLDDFLGELVEQGALKGDAAAQKAWSDAIGLRREFGKRFETNKVIEDIVSKDLTQEEMMDKLLGASKMGFKKESGKVVRDVKKILGPESEGFKSLKEEAFLKLFRNQPETGFSGQKFETAWKNMRSDNPTLVRELFTKQEMADIDRLVSVAQNVTKRIKGIENPSRSATVFARLIQGDALPGVFGSIVRAAIKPVRETKAAGEAARAVNVLDKIAEVRPKNDLFTRAIILNQEQE